MRCCLKEKFGTFGAVNAIIEVAATGRLRFFHTRIAAAMVGHTRRPYLLRADWSQKIFVEIKIEGLQCWKVCDRTSCRKMPTGRHA